MAILLSNFPALFILLLLQLRGLEAATVVYDFNITWVRANPDGLFERSTIGINNQWPLPIIYATVGDTVIVNVDNQLGNQSTTLHFHGLYMNGTAQMDGPLQVSQCDITPGTKFRYNFTIDQPGTYWYHSHSKGQYPDGLRAPLIVEDPNSPYTGNYDHEIVMSVSDWYHDQMQTLIPKFLSRTNPTGAEPVPNSVLVNDTQNVTVSIEPGKTYLFRMVNIGAFAGQYIWFEGHTMSIVEVDGIYTKQSDANMIYLAAAQRCSFLITAKNDTTTNYAFIASMDTDLFDHVPNDLNYNATGWLVYDSSKALPDPASVDDLNPFDDFTLIPFDRQELLPEPDQAVNLTVIMANLGDGANYAFFNNITYTSPKVPTLYTVMSSGAHATDAAIYGQYSHSFVLEKDQVIQIIVNNNDIGKHPFHLHGHNFQAIWRSDEDAGNYVPTSDPDFPQTPMRRDTFTVHPNGNIVLRFRADNPGVWLFHCHIEWHVNSGLVATMVEAPLELQKSLTIPPDHIAACEAAGTQYIGNAAGNSVNFFDLSGQNEPPAPLPAGFTPRGIVALTFSIVAGLLGIGVISWYGLAELGASDLAAEGRRMADTRLGGK